MPAAEKARSASTDVHGTDNKQRGANGSRSVSLQPPHPTPSTIQRLNSAAGGGAAGERFQRRLIRLQLQPLSVDTGWTLVDSATPAAAAQEVRDDSVLCTLQRVAASRWRAY
jgi:hypothetical protein